MSAQEGGSKRNFIALVSDKTEEQRAIASPANSDRRVRDYFLGLMAAALKRRGAAKWSPRPLTSPPPGKTG